jgi:sugar O-acyltransferase (sialic acid O-acetyltransferase NeuD family)
MTARRVVIFGVGAPLTIDVEESCARLGIEITAGVRNVEGPSYASAKLSVVDAAAISETLLALGVVLPMFTPAHRLAAFEDARRRGFPHAETIVDPTSAVAKSATIGAGVYVNSGCTVGGAAVLGDFVFINRAVSIGHHTRLDDFVSVGPGATLTGSLRIGRGAVIGAGAVILPQLEIGANAVIGAGSVVTQSVPAACLAVGNPARVVKTGLAELGVVSVTRPTYRPSE